jgi:hypothetical protein
MADTQTTNLNLIKPEPGAAENTWGISLNSNLDDIDAIFASGGTEVNMRFNSANFDDTKQINFGTDDDANIRHDGNNTKFTHNGSGGLYIGADTFCLQNGTHDENFICMADNGAVDLYYDNVKKLETTANGVTISGDMVLNGTDSIKVSAGTTAQRNASPVNGMFRYNTTTNEFEGYQNNAWGAIGGGGTTVNNNADNRIITGSSTADTLEAETDLTYNAGTLAQGSGDFTLDMAGSIILDSSQNVNLYAQGTHYAYLQNENSDFRIGPIIQDKDFIVRGNDGGTYINGLTIDFSDAGRAILNGGANVPNSKDIDFGTGTNTWTGEKGAKIQNHNNVFYIQFTTLFATRNSSGTSVTSVDTSGNGIFKGNVTAYGTPSDIKLKEDIKVIDNAVDKVKQLQGITYTLKSDGNRLTGLIAQDLEKVLPEAVYTAETIGDELKGEKPEEHLAIRYGNTVGLLVEAIKELEARIKELENK